MSSQATEFQGGHAGGSRRLHEAAWPDMFANLQSAYAELTEAQFTLEQRTVEIEETRDLLQQVVESMSEALFLMNRAGLVTQVNTAACVLLGRDQAELVGRSFSEVCGIGDIPYTPWQLLGREPSGQLTELEAEIPAGGGSPVPVSISCGIVRDKRGKITGVLVVAHDISERKRAEQALAQQAEELARSNAELEQFAYVASHDLQEPLRMVASFTELLHRRYQGALDQDADEFIEFIVDGAVRMQKLIKDLLAYSRVGRMGKEFAPVDCARVFETACTNLRVAVEESGAAVTASGLPTVVADETELVQLFQNLIGNAIKFRSDRPVEIQVGAERQEGAWLLWVRDNGIGIDLQYVERIFLIFQRLQSRAKYPGTGIGLAICKKIVERHGGRIWVESEPGNGSAFFFTMPDRQTPA